MNRSQPPMHQLCDISEFLYCTSAGHSDPTLAVVQQFGHRQDDCATSGSYQWIVRARNGGSKSVYTISVRRIENTTSMLNLYDVESLWYIL